MRNINSIAFCALIFWFQSMIFQCTHSFPCSSHRHCFDNNPHTIDFCTPHRRCMNLPRSERPFSDVQFEAIPTTSRQAGRYVPTNRQDLIQMMNSKPLSPKAKHEIVNTSEVLLKEFNPHRYLQLNLLKIEDPLERLQQLHDDIDNGRLNVRTNADFHSAMIDIYQSLRDYHTLYLRPPPLSQAFASLDQVTFHEYYENGSKVPKYTVTIADDSEVRDPDFVDGVEILRYNGKPIAKVISRIARRQSYGSNNAAQQADGAHLLAYRLFSHNAFPDADTISLEYKVVGTGRTSVVELSWRYFVLSSSLPPRPGMTPEPEGASARMAGNHNTLSRKVLKERMLVRRNERHDKLETAFSLRDTRVSQLFEAELSRISSFSKPFPLFGWYPTSVHMSESPFMIQPEFRTLVDARIVKAANDTYVGHISLPSFIGINSASLRRQYTQILRVMEQRHRNWKAGARGQNSIVGIVLDIRGNIGGEPDVCKLFLNLASSKTVVGNPTSVRSTPFVRKVLEDARRIRTRLISAIPIHGQIGRVLDRVFTTYRHGVLTALKVGERFTGAGPSILSPTVEDSTTNAVYTGPLITLVDAETFSAGDIFASIVADSGISKLVGVSDNVGAGGGSTSRYSAFSTLFGFFLDTHSFPSLPGGVDISMAFIRYYRTGRRIGAIVQSIGLSDSIERVYRTLDDVLEDDKDLFKMLTAMFLKKDRM